MVEYKTKTKQNASLSKYSWTVTHSTAPATLLAQSLFIIRNPRQVTNIHLWYISTLILRLKTEKVEQTDGWVCQTATTQTQRNQSQSTDHWHVATRQTKLSSVMAIGLFTSLFKTYFNKTHTNLFILFLSIQCGGYIWMHITTLPQKVINMSKLCLLCRAACSVSHWIH